MVDTFSNPGKIGAMRGKKTQSRQAVHFSALIGSPLERFVLGRAIETAISNSPLRTSGLQQRFDLNTTPELFFDIHLYSTGTTTAGEVKRLLLSIPGVYQVHDLSRKMVDWSELHHEEYFIDQPELPEANVVPSDLECEGEDAFPTPMDDLKLADEEPKHSTEHILRNKRLRNSKAVWEHRQTAGGKRGHIDWKTSE
jgi:hypothetical protein